MTSNKVVVTLPEVTIQDLIIDTDTLEFYDVTTSLFNQTQQSDVVVAVNYAKEDVKQKCFTSPNSQYKRLYLFTDKRLFNSLRDKVKICDY